MTVVRGVRRFVLLFAALSGATAATSTLVGLAAGSALSRAVSLGFYVVGAGVTLAGVVVMNRSPLRTRGGVQRPPAVPALEQTLGISAILIAGGLALLVLGVLADSRVRLL